MKTQEELNALKEEYESLNNKLQELNEEELKQVTGGLFPVIFASTIRNILNNVSDLQGNSNQTYREPPGSIQILREPLKVDSAWTPNYHDENGGAIYYELEKKNEK